jgi:hypothetical protein
MKWAERSLMISTATGLLIFAMLAAGLATLYLLGDTGVG